MNGRIFSTTLTLRKQVDRDARLITFLVEEFEGLPGILTPLEADKAKALVHRALRLGSQLALFAVAILVFGILIGDFAADDRSERFE